MSVNVILYNTEDSEKVANKSLTQIASINGDVRSNITLLDELIIRVEFNGDVSNVNYCYINSPYNRYYYVTRIECECAGIYVLSLISDVLTSFKSDFNKWSGIVKRQENNYNLLLNDGSFRVYQNPIVIQKEFPNGFSGQEYVLLCAGIPIEHT